MPDPKAYRVHAPGCGDCHALLVYATSHREARYAAAKTYSYGDVVAYAYLCISARRAPAFDAYRACGDERGIVWRNDDLPPDAPRFYDED